MKQFLKDTLYLLAFMALVLVALCDLNCLSRMIPLWVSVPLFGLIVAFMFRDCF